ncbi:MAG: MFS transporter [Zetaproteobacteria bacterium]|nr:MAG: MFS transporter [Zetaproteobacteria bacterium]
MLRDADLLRLDFGIFSLHAVMTAIFTALPFVLRDRVGIAPEHHAWVYLAALVLAMALMVPFVIIAERRGKMKEVFVAAIAGVALAAAILAKAGSLAVVGFALWLFFLFYNVLEATLPSWISRAAPLAARGAAMGVYSSSQFLGAFAGGALGGLAHASFGEAGVFAAAAVWMLVWLVVAIGQRPPRMLATKMLHLDRERFRDRAEAEAAAKGVAGVVEAFVDWDGEAVLLRVDPKVFDEAKAKQTLSGARA